MCFFLSVSLCVACQSETVALKTVPLCRRQSNLQKKVDQKKARKQQKREKRFLGAGFEGRTSGLRS